MPMIRKRSRRRRRSRRSMRTLLLVLGIAGLILGVLLVAVFAPRALWQPVKLGIIYLATGLGLLGVWGLMVDRSGT